MEPLTSTLSSWQNFYVVVGSSAGALTGLQFVVIALIAQVGIPAGKREIRAFSTPTVVHFCLALLTAAIMCAPWRISWGISASLLGVGVFGIWFVCTSLWHARKSTVYKPDLEDWIMYNALPLLIYLALLCAAILFQSMAGISLTTVAAAAVALVMIGIRNAWDTVTFITTRRDDLSNPTDAAGQSTRPKSAASTPPTGA